LNTKGTCIGFIEKNLATILVFNTKPCAAQDVPVEDPTETGPGDAPPGFGDDSLKATGVGISGGIIAGGEIVVAIEAAIGVDKLWAYLTFPFLGAAGGGVGGYYLEKASPGGAVALLVISMAAFIPTAIYASTAMAYNPEKEGAVQSDPKAGPSPFSFEETPGEATTREATSTEVQSDEQPPADGTEPTPKADSPPAQTESPAPPAPDQSGAEGPQSSLKQRKALALRNKMKRAMAGSLLYVDGQGTAAVTVPFVDVRRNTGFPDDRRLGTPRRGLEVYVPLIRIDLP
jgi:hypothetical protein